MKTKNHKKEKVHKFAEKENGLNNTGRPTKYKPEYCKQIIQFFDCEKTKEIIKSEITGKDDYNKKEYKTIANELPTLIKFAKSIGVDYTSVYHWQDKDNPQYHEEFFKAYNTAKELQKEFLIQNGLAGFYPPASFIFVAKNITSMRDKIETEIKIPAQIQIVNLPVKYANNKEKITGSGTEKNSVAT